MDTDKKPAFIFIALALVCLSGCQNGTWTPMCGGRSTADGHVYNPATAEALKKESNLESPSVQYSLGYAFGAVNEKPDWQEAAKWYRKAAEKGHRRAQRELGEIYYYGRGVEKNLVEALFWYEATGFKDCGQVKSLVKSLSRGEVESIRDRLIEAGWFDTGQKLNADLNLRK